MSEIFGTPRVAPRVVEVAGGVRLLDATVTAVDPLRCQLGTATDDVAVEGAGLRQVGERGLVLRMGTRLVWVGGHDTPQAISQQIDQTVAGLSDAALIAGSASGILVKASGSPWPTARRNGAPLADGDLLYVLNASGQIADVRIRLAGGADDGWPRYVFAASDILATGTITGPLIAASQQITSPTILAGEVIGARVATADTGPRTELSTTGLARYRAGTDGDGLVTTVELGGSSSDRLALTDGAGEAKVALDGATGQAGFAGPVNATDFTIGGESLAARIAALPQGVVCFSRLTIDGPSAGTGAVGLVMMAAQISTSRMYRVHLEGVVVGANAGDVITFVLQTHEPSQVQRNIGNFVVTGANYVSFDTTIRGHLDGAARYSIVYYNSTANRSVRLRGRTGYPAVMTLEDLGAARYNQGGAYARFDLLGGTPLDGGTVPPNEEVPEIFTKLYPLSWSRSWRGGSITTDGLQQGYWSPHQRYSILGFGGTLATDMAGATILGARVFLQSRTWWGPTGKAKIGVSALTAAPANPVTTGSTVDSPAFAEGGTQWTDIGSLWTPSMRAITLGVGAGTANIYYGKLAPAATLEVTYRK